MDSSAVFDSGVFTDFDADFSTDWLFGMFFEAFPFPVPLSSELLLDSPLCRKFFAAPCTDGLTAVVFAPPSSLSDELSAFENKLLSDLSAADLFALDLSTDIGVTAGVGTVMLPTLAADESESSDDDDDFFFVCVAAEPFTSFGVLVASFPPKDSLAALAGLTFDELPESELLLSFLLAFADFVRSALEELSESDESAFLPASLDFNFLESELGILADLPTVPT